MTSHVHRRSLGWGRTGNAFCLGLLALLLTAPVRADWIMDASLGFNYDDNVPLAQHRHDREGDGALVATVSPGKYFQLNDRVGLSLTADFTGTRQFDFHALDNFSAGVRAGLHAKLGLGAYAPWLRISAAAAHRSFKSNLRDGWRYTFDVVAGRRISERWTVQFRYAYERRNPDHITDIPALVSTFGIHGDAFRTSSNGLSAGAICLVNNKLALILDYTRRMGEVTSTTHRDPEIFDASDAITADPAFGPDRFAYRIHADANIFSASMNYALGEHAAVEAGYQYQDAWSYEDVKYRNSIVHLQLLYSY